jgi:hypothetical protein
MNRAMRSVGAVSNSREGTAVAQPSVNIVVVSRAAARWFTGIFLKADKQPPSDVEMKTDTSGQKALEFLNEMDLIDLYYPTDEIIAALFPAFTGAASDP